MYAGRAAVVFSRGTGRMSNVDSGDGTGDDQRGGSGTDGEHDWLPAERELDGRDDGTPGRVASMLARTFGEIMNPTVAGLLTLAAVVTRRPELTGLAIPAGAVAGVASEEAVMAWHRAWAGGGVQNLVEEIESASGDSIEDVMGHLQSNRKLTGLLGGAVNAAAQSVDPWNVRALGRAFVAGAKNEDKVDAMTLLANALPGVQGSHARVMAVLGKREPYRFTVDEVARLDPGLGHTVAILSRDLERLGLVIFVEWNVVALSAMGWSCASLLDELGSLPDVALPDQGF